MESVELKICKNLINSNFEGYKLSLDSLPIYKAQISNGKYYDRDFAIPKNAENMVSYQS